MIKPINVKILKKIVKNKPNYQKNTFPFYFTTLDKEKNYIACKYGFIILINVFTIS